MRLAEAEKRICAWVGEQRFLNAREYKRDPGQGPTSGQTAANDIVGAETEFCGSVIFNLYWRPSVGRIRDCDVGGLLEVRSTGLVDGRLIVKPKDKDRPFVLIRKIEEEFDCPGWMMANEAKCFPLESRFGDPAHYIQQKDLHPKEELLDWLRHRR